MRGWDAFVNTSCGAAFVLAMAWSEPVNKHPFALIVVVVAIAVGNGLIDNIRRR